MPYFIKDNRGGGAEVQAYLKAKHLAQKGGLEVIYLTSNPGDKPQEEFVEGIRVLRKLRMPFPLRNTFTIFRETLRIKPCIVYTRMNWPAVLPIGLASKIIKAQTLWFATEARGLSPFYNLKKFFNTAKNYYGAKYKLPLLLINAILEDLFFQTGIYLMDKHFVQNTEQLELLKKYYHIEAKLFPSVHEIPDEYPRKSPNPTIIWIANFSDNKRPELFLEIAKALPEYQFIMAGNIRPDYEWIKKSAPDNLKILGRISLEESEKLFEKAWIYVNTSLKEGFPNTFIQAWKYRTAVVSMNVDPDGLLTKKRLGILTNNSLKITIEAIKELVKNEDFREEIISRAYKYVKLTHNVKKLIHFDDFYCYK